MRAEIDENGMLSVIPESQIETFALRVWWEDYARDNPSSDTSVDEKPKFAVLHARLIERI